MMMKLKRYWGAQLCGEEVQPLVEQLRILKLTTIMSSLLPILINKGFKGYENPYGNVTTEW
jgi:hypothetical protein